MTTPNLLREIVILPFHLDPAHAGAVETVFAGQRLWLPEPSPFANGAETIDPQLYAEFVYFHPYARRFLYPAGDDGVTTWHRDDIKQVRLQWDDNGGPASLTLEVFATRLHLFADCGIGLITLEIGWDGDPPAVSLADGTRPLGLGDVEDLLDRFRRLHPPYWNGCDPASPGHCFTNVQWLDAACGLLAQGDYRQDGSYLGEATRSRHPALAGHWRWLLQPLRPRTCPDDSEPIAVDVLGDERLPLMAWMAFEDPHAALTRGDFVRLAMADDRGESATLPYSARFLERFEERHCYDRFWEPGGGWMNTRYLCTGYAFVMVGQDDRGSKNRFFTDDRGGGLAHFRRHYGKIALTVHLQRAGLLAFSDRLSEAVAEAGGVGNDDRAAHLLSERVRPLQLELLRFTHRYWFTEVTGHVQGQEIYRWWSDHLGTKALYEQLHGELEKINTYLDARSQERQADRTERLTWAAVAALAPSLAATVWGLSDFAPVREWLVQSLSCLGRGGTAMAVLLTLAASGAVIGVIYKLLRWVSR